MGVPGVNVQGTLAGRPKTWRLGAGDRDRCTREKRQCPNPGKKWGAGEREPEMGQWVQTGWRGLQSRQVRVLGSELFQEESGLPSGGAGGVGLGILVDPG